MSNRIGREDVFFFECTLCGQCCSGPMKVFLNPRDLKVLGTHFKMSHTAELWKAGYLVTETGQNGFPFPRLNFTGHTPGFCPFIINDWQFDENRLKAVCSLHGSAKPLVCRLAPAARDLDFDSPQKESWHIQAPVDGCPGMNSLTENQLKQYLAPLEDELLQEELFFENLKEGLDGGLCPEELFKKYFLFSLTDDDTGKKEALQTIGLTSPPPRK